MVAEQKSFIEKYGLQGIIVIVIALIVLIINKFIPTFFINKDGEFDIIQLLTLLGTIVVVVGISVLVTTIIIRLDKNSYRKNNEIFTNLCSQLKTENEKSQGLNKQIKEVNTKCTENNNNYQSTIKLLKSLYDKKIESLLTIQELAELEMNVNNGEEIIIQTSDFRLEENHGFRQIMLDNFEKGVKYTYLIPNETVLKNRFKKNYEGWVSHNSNIKNLVDCYALPKEFFFMTIIIYNSGLSEHEKNKHVIIKFASTLSIETYPFVLKMADTSSVEKKLFHDNLLELIKLQTQEKVC